MAEDTDNLVLDILRAIRTDIGAMRSDINDLKASDISLRNHFHNMQGDFLRQEQGIAAIRIDVDIIKKRLELVEA